MPHPTYTAIIQARLGSTRLPLKSLLTLRGTPLIEWVVSRVAQAKRLTSYCVAIPDTRLDTVLKEHLEARGIPCVVGSENDVLDRFCKAAAQMNASHIIRVCADNPLIWGEAIDRLIEHYETHAVDYAYNHIPRNNLWPDGLGAELVSRELLESLQQEAKLPSQREHCLNYIWDTPTSFRISTFDPTEPWLCHPEIKLDIDTVEDFTKIALLPIRPTTPIAELIRAALGSTRS